MVIEYEVSRCFQTADGSEKGRQLQENICLSNERLNLGPRT